MQDMSPIAFLSLTMKNGTAGGTMCRDRGDAGLPATDYPTRILLNKETRVDAGGESVIANERDNGVIELFPDALIFAS
jgi:hypothetical protein